MENNFQPADLAVIANALEYYRDYMMQDIELSADHPNIARYFRRCAEDANKVLQSVRAELGLPEKPWKYADVVAQTAADVFPELHGGKDADHET